MEKKYWVALLQAPAITQKRFFKLLNFFKSGYKIWEAQEEELRLSGVLKDADIEKFLNWKKTVDPDRIWENLKKRNINVVTFKEENYPSLLKKIYDPPPILYYMGQLRNTNKTISIVGCRNATPYGKKVAEKLAKRLAEHGFIIVSGMARGIDTYAHKGALSAGKETFAVLGCGVDVVYPPENKKLYNDILESGCILSEFPPGTRPLAWHFPLRNRIISGLAKGVVVVEAALKSGTLITVDQALEQGRDVFSVPGPITSKYSTGTNNLIKQGAKPVTCLEDILEEYDCEFVPNVEDDNNERVQLSENEKKVLSQLEVEPCDIDNIVRITNLKVTEVNSILTILELKGLIKKLPGKKYIRI